MDTLSGSVERVTFFNQDNGYTVLRLRPTVSQHQRTPGMDFEGLVTVVGNLPELSTGEHLRLQGQWISHPKHGTQFTVEFCEQTLPATLVGIESYLGSGMIKGIGPKLAERIVSCFKEETFDVIEKTPERLLEVSGIGSDRCSKISKAWEEQKSVKEIMVFLHAHGVSTSLAVKIYKTYGDSSLEIVQKNPYQLEQDIYGIGFKTADRIAQALGLPSDHPSRIEAGLIYSLSELINEGHVYAPREKLLSRAIELLGVHPDLLPSAIDRLIQSERVKPDVVPFPGLENQNSGEKISEQQYIYGTSVIYLTPLYFGERGVAERLLAMVDGQPENGYGMQLSFPDSSLSDEQQAAVQMALSSPVSILTGGPGTGKTTCLKALTRTLEMQGKRVALASPTGRAAKRLAESTGHPAVTIHRLLEFSPINGFKHNQENPLPIDFLVVDEASMLDLLLMNNLLKAIRSGTQILFVGDVDQLPSVGAGDVLRNMISSQLIPVIRLTTIFRQAADSQIISNAHRINQGKMPVFSTGESDFYLFPAEDAEKAADWVIDLVAERIPQKFGVDALRDIQVLSPIYRGSAGVISLNERLQQKLNPASNKKSEKKLFGLIFRVGDKVMQTQNNYDKDIYNGDIGYIMGIDNIEHLMQVDFENKIVNYDWSEADQLALAYVISIHKSQGSEFPVIVLPIVTQHYMMLQRNLFYTAVTRARRLVVLTGSKTAISMAVNNHKLVKRFTALDLRLKHLI